MGYNDFKIEDVNFTTSKVMKRNSNIEWVMNDKGENEAQSNITWEEVYRGSLSDCNAYIQLRIKGCIN